MKRVIAFSAFTAICFTVAVGHAQQASPGQVPAARPAAREDALDPTPIDASKDPNIDLFINDWRNSQPRAMYGKLVFRDILTRLEGADPAHPAKKGAVLTNITAISYVTLDPGATVEGRAQAGERQVFYTVAGNGTIIANAKAIPVQKGLGFTLAPELTFKLSSMGKEPLAFYVRTEPLPANYQPSADLVVVDRFENDRRVGAHWAHINNGGANGMTVIEIAPRTIPQPHSHPAEECWLMVEGETILSLGKNIVRMTPGQAYKIPPTGVTAHSNLNMGDEPVQMIFMGPAANQNRGPRQPGQTGNTPADFSRLDNGPFNRLDEQDIDMFMGNWRDSFPRIMHGNLYFRDMLTGLQGGDPLHPTRRGAVLTNAEAVSYVMLEPGSSAHKVEGEMKGIQQTFVVNAGSGFITAGSKRVELSKDMAFVITPGLDFRLTATGDKHMTFYVVSEKLAPGFTPKATFDVVDNRGKAATTNAWVNRERPLIAKDHGLSQYSALSQVEMGPMTMSQAYSDGASTEEIWIATEGDVDILFGKEMRKLPVGSAYRAPSTGITAHSNINATNKPARFIRIVK